MRVVLAQQWDFDSTYNCGREALESDIQLASHCLQSLQQRSRDLSPVQLAKLNFLKLKIIYADPDKVRALEERMVKPPDSLGFADALLYMAHKYLDRSMPDKAIPLLMKSLDTIPPDTERSDRCIIELTEAYRQKQEYAKGVVMLRELLGSGRSLAGTTRAFAYNRLAALYNEWGNKQFATADSVIKYSKLCIAISDSINCIPNLALAQNELSVQFARKKQYKKALELSAKAIGNFKEAGMKFSAMNALINRSNFYFDLKLYDSAFQSTLEATNLCPIEENRNLFMRLYLQLGCICEKKGNYKDALGFMIISRQMLSDFFYDRLNEQIAEQTAKYDLFAKEQNLHSERQKNEFQKKQFTFLIAMITVVCIALVISLFYFRLRKRQQLKQRLIEAVIDTETNERKRIARDLHDGIGPILSAVNHYFQAYMDARDEDKEAIQKKMQQVLTGAIDEVSRISHNISPYALENHGLTAALNDFIQPVRNGSKIRVEFTTDFSGRFDLKKEITLYRCITELLNNTMRHAQATLIELGITRKDKALQIFYSDNGKGFEMNMALQSGMGMNNIKNRVETIGGKLLMESYPQKGIKVFIEVPVTYEF
ncbi:MAG TPA: sensor histidine kinase [Bacteroidales bacterium]|nr:sensor histidine kinase [Bacteroidales bacterium]HSA43757.1 sensor histidine kinase [Bacteroidales bacterium]